MDQLLTIRVDITDEAGKTVWGPLLVNARKSELTELIPPGIVSPGIDAVLELLKKQTSIG